MAEDKCNMPVCRGKVTFTATAMHYSKQIVVEKVFSCTYVFTAFVIKMPVTSQACHFDACLFHLLALLAVCNQL